MASREARVTREETEKKLTQSRLRPISPFSYVGRGRKGAKTKDKIAAKRRKKRKKAIRGRTGFDPIGVQ